MKLLFSGADNFQSEQKDKNKSLGGNVSLTPIPNGKINALFSQISLYSKKNKSEENLAVFILNDTNSDINNLTIENVYQKELDKKVNSSIFKFAAVEPNDENKIELIGSIKDFPFNANFFKCETIKESCILSINEFDENVEILNEQIEIEKNDIEGMIEDIVEHFEDVDEYNIQKHSETEMFIESNSLIETNLSIKLINDQNELLSNNVSLSGYKDGKVEIKDILKPGEYLGLWIQRKLKNKLPETDSKIDNTEIFLSHN